MLSSILIQLCHQSDEFSQVLSSIYSTHGDGSREPSIDVLLECLKTMLTLPGQATIYIVVDALDESPNSSGLPTQREQVLKTLKALIDMKLPHLRFCITSRPESDIRGVLESLNPCNVSLHEQDGQKKDVARYVESVVNSDSVMQNWPEKTKTLVINTLAKNGGGMYVIVDMVLRTTFLCDDFRFRWAYCQLEALRKCPMRNISRTLKKLPKTLDETYGRILQGLPEEKWEDAHRIFQWLTISSRPLRVEELAEVFAIDFDEESSGIPNFEPSWRDQNSETAVLSACSTLVTVVEFDGQKVVQFSHFSVREYLTSDRIADLAPVSHFHILPKPAHSLLSKACLSVLFQLDYDVDESKIHDFPLAFYAAEHWVDHAGFEDVSSDIRDGMDRLFDRNKPHFAAWVWVCNIDDKYGGYDVHTPHPEQPDAVPLYYAALCGFHGLTERLLASYPQDLDAQGGIRGFPLNAALHNGHRNIALFLLEHGADVESRGLQDQTPLYMASSSGYTDVVRSLIERRANPNAECADYDERGDTVTWTPLHAAIDKRHLDVLLLLLESGAYVDHRGGQDQTALYLASSRGYAEAIRTLIDSGADPNAKCYDLDEDGYVVRWTPLLVASRNGSLEIARMLLIHGADLNYQDQLCRGPLLVASRHPSKDLARFFLDHGANPDTSDCIGNNALHRVSIDGNVAAVMLFLEYGANVDAAGNEGWTPLHYAAREGHLEVLRLLLDHGADANARTDNHRTALRLATAHGHMQIVEALLKCGAHPPVRSDNDERDFNLGQNRPHMRWLLGNYTSTGEVADPQSCVLM